MTKSEERAVELVKELIPNFNKLEFKASISDTSHSIEFFVWIGNEKWQCFELADNGEIDESKMEKLFDTYAQFFRKSDGYKTGEVNKINLFQNLASFTDPNGKSMAMKEAN